MLKYALLLLAFVGLYADGHTDAILAKYERPFTFLGIGNGSASFIKNLASAYPESVFIAFDQKEENLSLFSNTIVLNHQLESKEVTALASCEHVDILLVIGDEWEEWLPVFQQMAHVVIFKDHRIEMEEPFRLIKTTLIHPRKTQWKYDIYCDYKRKFLFKTRPNWTCKTDWIPGINMMTYLIFNGAVPSRSQVLNSLPIDEKHSDWVPNNMIVQGRKIFLIDKDDPISTPVSPDGGARFLNSQAKAREFISSTPNKSPKQVREAFISIYNWGNYFDQTEIKE